MGGFNRFRPTAMDVWIPGYLDTWIPGYLDTWMPGCLGCLEATTPPSQGSLVVASACKDQMPLVSSRKVLTGQNTPVY